MEEKKLIDWLEEIIKTKAHLDEVRRYNDEIRTLDGWYDKEIHMGAGLEIVARELRKVITYNPNYSAERGEAYFEYCGHKVFTLWEKGA